MPTLPMRAAFGHSWTMACHPSGICVDIVGILASMGVPQLFKLLRDQKVSTATDTFANNLKYTQSEAIRSSTPATICIANQQPPTACGTTSSDNWSQGWVVFHDTDSETFQVEVTSRQCGHIKSNQQRLLLARAAWWNLCQYILLLFSLSFIITFSSVFFSFFLSFFSLYSNGAKLGYDTLGASYK